jgi:glycine/D-amino acid oxidase-like deaminating enzyme
MRYEAFVRDAVQMPYWWKQNPRPVYSEVDFPVNVDVAVVGTGYTGLMAGITLARRGRSVVIFDAHAVGFGASSRNTGMLGPSFPKCGMTGLVAAHGKEKALAIMRECLEALAYTTRLIKSEPIECAFAQVGRFVAALRPKDYESLGRHADMLRSQFKVMAHAVPRAEQRAEIGTDLYHGGLVLESDACLHPGLYHQGLVELARSSGALIVPDTAVTAITRDGARMKVVTSRQVVHARNVVVATNGYTGSVTPFLRRRVIPISSAIIATEPLPAGQMDRLMPKRRMIEEKRRVLNYYRSSPDGERILFGGRAAGSDDQPIENSRRLYAAMLGIFPELEGARIEYNWTGLVGYTFDYLPHLGEVDGTHYAVGCCGSGIGRSTWLGHKIAHKILGDAAGHTAFDDVRFQTRPLYYGAPWFLGPAVAWQRLRDRVGF